jgi:histidyl-tRNA synthetase
MDFIKTPVKGMPEQMPGDMLIREYAMNKIKTTYGKYGFLLIETPAVEHIENLTNRQGGENEQLIFKILKRGEKLKNESDPSQLCDCGLRYDLTVPLARFYANNCGSLPLPFKALQIGNSWRADRPQKGRYRQFTQCDIDIIGDNSCLAEIEVISATAGMLHELGLGDCTVRINDRRILRSMAKSCGFAEEKMDLIFIVLDKLDKIGISGVHEELIKMGLDADGVDKYCRFFDSTKDEESSKKYFDVLDDAAVEQPVIDNLEKIMRCVRKMIANKGKVVFDPTLVRGMSYYTGPIFEIELASYHLSIAGGGRYDEMIGKYSGNNAAACGFSIGFERIIAIIKENGILMPDKTEKTAYLVARDVDTEKLERVLSLVEQLRLSGKTVMVSPRNNNAKAQKEKLRELGYDNFIEVFAHSEI